MTAALDLTLHPRLAAMQATSAPLGIICLDTVWQGEKHHYRFKCSHGHEWLRRAIVQRYNARCKGCMTAANGVRQRNADNMRKLLEIVRAHGGACLSDEYRGTLARYQFRCAAGHEWESNCHNVLHGAWCRRCATQLQARKQLHADGMARLHERAHARGGQCLSGIYEGIYGKYRFSCAAGHEWEVLGHDVLHGSWCMPCARAARKKQLLKSDGLALLQQYARDRGGECLSGEYLGKSRAHRFRCAQGHEWESMNAMKGSWCRRCAGDKRRLTIGHAQRLAESRGGRCLSTEYVNSQAKLSWECHRGHVWQADYNGAQQGRWCKQCASMNMISNRNSKARRKYGDAGARLLGDELLHGTAPR